MTTIQGVGTAERDDARLVLRYLLEDADGPNELTPSEHAVALLAASGLTNREIATRRFVSVKAIEYHLGNAYRKLGIVNRAGLAMALDATGVRADVHLEMARA